jgi:hypothetical protein
LLDKSGNAVVGAGVVGVVGVVVDCLERWFLRAFAERGWAGLPDARLARTGHSFGTLDSKETQNAQKAQKDAENNNSVLAVHREFTVGHAVADASPLEEIETAFTAKDAKTRREQQASRSARSASAFGNADDPEPRPTRASAWRPQPDADLADHADLAD